MTSRDKLRAAHAAKAEAAAVLDAARKATAAAAAHLRDAEADLARHVARADGARDARAARIVAAAKAGSAPTVEPATETPEAMLARVDAEARRDAAAAALDLLQAEERTASAALEDAARAVAEAAKHVAAEQADTMAREIADLEAKALALRARLGGRFGFAASLPVADVAAEVIRASDATAVGAVNTAEFHEARRCSDAWRDHVAELLSDPDACLDFEEEIIAAAAA